VPVLPQSILEVLSSPTPYIIGVHSMHQESIDELLDVVIVDLDGGFIKIPENMTIHQIMEPVLSHVLFELSLVLRPELRVADCAFTSHVKTGEKSAEMLDKELRAVMLRLMVQLLQGYRSCLTLVRIHPEPYITFHKSAFLGLRNLSQDCEFISRFLDCMFFQEFITKRGPPWRKCDTFDELYANIGEQLFQEMEDPKKILPHIEELAKELYANENSSVANSGQPYSQRIPLPMEGHMMRVHQPIFPTLDPNLVHNIIKEGELLNNVKDKDKPVPKSSQLKLVPMGQQLVNGSLSSNTTTIVPNSARRLEVLRNCISSIFENKIADAKKSFPTVIRALKGSRQQSRAARLALCEELSVHVTGNQAMLEHQQFDLVVRLMNAALQDDSDNDMYGVAAAILPLSNVFGRKLCTGVIQFVYTLIQDHAVWQNQQFWESSFFNDVQKGIKELYLALQEQRNNGNSRQELSTNQLSVEKHAGSRAREVRKSAVIHPDQPSVLELAASELRRWNTLEGHSKAERIMQEEQVVYSQAIHYTTRMINMMIPINYNQRNGKFPEHNSDLVSNSISNSVAESDSIDAESGFDDTEPDDNGTSVSKFVARFADKVCGESSVSENHLKALHQMIPGVVAMHLETMESVTREAKRLPPIQKPKINRPSLLPGEELVEGCPGLRVYLLPDGREECCGGVSGGPVLLPAEGAIFLTNYRIVFKGNPIDPFAAEHTVMRSFPVTTLTREKRFGLSEYVSEIDQVLKEGIQLRSNTFQLIRAAFDDEVTAEDIETFRKTIHRVQFPPTLLHFFAFRVHLNFPSEPLSKKEDKTAKYSTIKGFASKTLKNVSKATGIKTKNKKSKYLLPNMQPMHGRLSVPDMSHEGKIREEDENSEAGEVAFKSNQPTSTRTMERLAERRYYRDWVRLGLGMLDVSTHNKFLSAAQPTEPTRISIVNHKFGVSRSLPPLLVVPGRVSDESLKRFSRVHRQGRFPTITWRHPKSKALLLRGSAYHARGVMGLIRRHQDNSGSGATASEIPSSVDAEQYLAAVVAAMPSAMLRPDSSWNMAASTTSINSLAGISDGLSAFTPTMSRRNNPFSRAMEGFGTLTRSSGFLSRGTLERPGSTLKRSTLTLGGKSGRPFGGRLSLSSVKGKPGLGSQTSLTGSGAIRGSYRSSADSEHDGGGSLPALQKAALYVFGDKSQVKGVKVESHPKADFIPVEYPEPRRLRASLKKLMRACAPSTAAPPNSDMTFLKLVEQSEWLQLLQTTMQLGGAVVDLMDIEGSSVMLCLEDGWDLTCQVSSLAQLCLDPHYRTIEGFRILIEKEWLAYGHRFNHRSNLSNQGQDSGFTPLFLQFLDLVHQLHNQFPMAFEFSQYYLKFLAYHHVSCRFRTFLLDSELDRQELGFTSLEDKSGTLPRFQKGFAGDPHSSDEEGGGPSVTLPGNHLGVSIFDYIERQSIKTPIFHNFLHCPDLQHEVLRPFSHMSDLVIWDYYTHEELKHGPSFDIELTNLDVAFEEEAEAASDVGSLRLGQATLTTGYDNMSVQHSDSVSHLLTEINRLEAELGILPRRWMYHWDRVEPPPAHPPPPPPQHHPNNVPPTQVTTPSMYARMHGRSVHKRSTMELLLRGKMGGAGGSSEQGGGASYTHQHRFEKYNYTTPTNCDLCNKVLWGIVRTGFKCQDCGLNCHEKCRENVPKACTKFRSVQSSQSTNDALDIPNRQRDSRQEYLFPARDGPSDEHSNIVYQGYLYKRGALLKAWKQRWFVLDTIKHQLRYYDTREDFHIKGTIDLSEVKGVSEGSSAPGAPKKADDRCFIDLKTIHRTYSLCADNRQQALEWMEKIQSCL